MAQAVFQASTKPSLQERIKELDLDTACMLTDEAEAQCRAALGCCQIAKSRLNHSHALDEGACTVLISVSTELADAASEIHQTLAASGITEGPLFRPVRRGGKVEAGRLSSRSVAFL
jgi:hypothetical protein